MASASSSMLPATMSWFAAFTVWPDPAGPTWTMVFPTASSTGLAASKSAASSGPRPRLNLWASCVRRSPGRHGHRRVGQPDLRIGQARFKKKRLGVRLSARPFRPLRGHRSAQRAQAQGGAAC
jgi:hypothetical protein